MFHKHILFNVDGHECACILPIFGIGNKLINRNLGFVKILYKGPYLSYLPIFTFFVKAVCSDGDIYSHHNIIPVCMLAYTCECVCICPSGFVCTRTSIFMDRFKNNFVKLPILTLNHTFPTFNEPKKETFWKTMWEKEKMLVTSIFSFSTMFPTHPKENLSHIYFVIWKFFQFGLV